MQHFSGYTVNAFLLFICALFLPTKKNIQLLIFIPIIIFYLYLYLGFPLILGILFNYLILYLITINITKNIFISTVFLNIILGIIGLAFFFFRDVYVFFNLSNHKFDYLFILIFCLLIALLIKIADNKYLFLQTFLFNQTKSFSCTIFILFIWCLWIIFIKLSTNDLLTIVITITRLLLWLVSIVYSFLLIEKNSKQVYIKNLVTLYHQKHVYYQELEEFKHDYKNILFSLDYLLESNQVTEAKQIFSQLKNYSKKILDNSVMEIDNIKVEAFKGLLLDFYGNAKTNNVPVSIIVTNNIESLPMDTFSFLRMLSILLTNALEHNQPNNQPIEIEITSNSNQFCFCISNSTTLNHLNLEHLFQRTYSQKKTGGLGLYILNKEINSNANIDYNIELEKAETNRFIFTLTILYP